MRHWRVQLSQTNSTAPGSTSPIRPFDNTPSAQATKPARAQPACGRAPCMKASAKHQMAVAIQAATIVSWLTYCPPSRKAPLAPSISAARRAKAGEAKRRAATYKPASISAACSAGTSRADQGEGPNTPCTLASSQCSSGGLCKNGMPFRRGVTQSPLIIIQRPTSA